MFGADMGFWVPKRPLKLSFYFQKFIFLTYSIFVALMMTNPVVKIYLDTCKVDLMA